MTAELVAWLHELVEYAGSPNFRASLHADLDKLAKGITMGDGKPAAKPAAKPAKGSPLFTPVK